MSAKRELLTAEQLRELLHYNPDTGKFTWRTYRRGHARGAVAGTSRRDGYVAINTGGRLYAAHRLAWLYMTGSWPVNLREATPSQNGMNAGPRANNKSGFKRVDLFRGKWRATITVDGKQIHLGMFDTPTLASVAYNCAALEYFGQFARKEPK